MTALKRGLSLVAAIAFLTFLWALLAAAVDSPALPGPIPALRELGIMLQDDLLTHVMVSAGRVLTALAIGLVVAVPTGLLAGWIPRLDALVAPIVFVTYPVPKVTFLPVFLVLLGTGSISKTALIALIVSFEIFVTVRDAARGIPAEAVQSARSLGASRWQVYRHVVVPASLPGVFTALRISTGHAIAVLFFAETVAGTDGLGYAVIDAWTRIQYSQMFAAVIAMALLGVVLYEAIEFIESRVCGWRSVS